MPTIIFAGEDTFRLRAALRKFLDTQASGAKTQSFESDTSEDLVQELREFFQTSTLWQERKVAIVKAPSWKNPLPEVTDPDLLILALEKPPPAGILKKTRLETFPKLKGAGLSKWIRGTAAEFGSEIDTALVSLLVELHGSETEAIWNELTILSCFKPGEKLSAKDLRAFRSWVPRVRNFAFVEAVLAKNRRQALRLLLYSLEEGAAPLALLAGLAAQFRAMLVAKSDGTESSRADASLPSTAAAAFFAGKHPFWLSKIEQASREFSEDELKAQLRRLERADWLIKTGKHSPSTALEEYIVGA